MPPPIPQSYFSTRFVIQDLSMDPEVNFAIVTAFNPQDEPRSNEANTKADRALYSELSRLGFEPFRATGGSPDWTHHEPGWGFSSSLRTALEIATRFNQRALWWIEDKQLHLVECSNPLPIHIAPLEDRILKP